jgi:hypothetical protein
MHHHNESNTKIGATAAAVSDWQLKVRTINEKIAATSATLAASDTRRRESALAASLGDDAAQKNLDQVLQDDIRAQRDLDNLKLSLPLAEAKLREAENLHRAEETSARKHDINRLVLERIEVTRQIDEVLASSLEPLLQTYEKLGHELFPLCVDHSSFVSRGEEIAGWLRVAKSLPPSFKTMQQRLPGVDFGGGPKLAVSESQYWGVAEFKKADAA